MGMEKRGGAWYGRGDGVVAITDLQRSQYGPKFYLNQGFWLNALGDDRYPKSARSHISIRLETLAQDVRGEIERLLDLESCMPDDVRLDRIVAVLEERLKPVLDRGQSLEGLRSMVEDGTLKAAAIRGSAQQLLSGPSA